MVASVAVPNQFKRWSIYHEGKKWHLAVQRIQRDANLQNASGCKKI